VRAGDEAPSVPLTTGDHVQGEVGSAPPIFVISLPESLDRRRKMDEQLSSFGLRYQFVDAVHGGRLTDRELEGSYDDAGCREHIGRSLAPGEIGCALSHLAIYKRMADERIEAAVVLEDDAVLSERFVAVLARLGELPRTVDLVCFDVRHDFTWWQWSARRIGGETIVRPAYRVTGTLAYFIRRCGAEKLYRAGFPVAYTADWPLDIGRHLRAHVMIPCPVTPSGDESIIGQLGRVAAHGPKVALSGAAVTEVRSAARARRLLRLGWLLTFGCLGRDRARYPDLHDYFTRILLPEIEIFSHYEDSRMKWRSLGLLRRHRVRG